MIYIEMLGRMGNQMFSYAHARYIQEKYPKQKIGIDFSNFENKDDSWINYLQYFSCWDNIEIAKRDMNLLQRIVLKLFYSARSKWEKGYRSVYANELKWAKMLERFGLYIFTNGYYPFQYKDHFRNKLLIGFFESDKYFLSIRSILREEFGVKGIEKKEIFQLITKNINSDYSICVGVRKGDFTSSENRDYCDICSPSYYENGVLKIKEEIAKKNGDWIEQWKIYVFTDDIDWVKKNVHFTDSVVYITSSVNGEIKPWEMLHVMTYFKYYVIPNSSFFWWAQFLSRSDSPMVIAPNRWRNSGQELYKDVYEKNWLLLEV